MLVRSLPEMEKIVSNNEDLVWDGWTVVSLKPIDSGLTSKNTVCINDKWYVQKRFELTEEGWDIPNKLAG